MVWIYSRMHLFDSAEDLVYINIISLSASSLLGLVLTWTFFRWNNRPTAEDFRRTWAYGKYTLGGNVSYLINPTGRFVVGGPYGDSGLTGRKIIVDTYGGMARHGGGAFSGKDPSKVDRSAAYMMRYVAKNVVAAGLAERCELQVAYAIGVAEPVSLLVDTMGTGKMPDVRLAEAVRKVFDLTPRAIIDALDLRKPIFRATSVYGHFGRPGFSWERTDRVEELKRAAG